MMKKILTLLLIALLLFSLTSCKDVREDDNSINVMFFTANNNASLVPSYLNLTEGQKIEKPEDPTREGYTFLGWYKDYYKTEAWDFDNDTVGTQSIVLYADWEPAIFEITYHLNGGEMPSDDYLRTFAVGDYGVLPLPIQPGYAFEGWYLYDWKDANGEITTIPGDNGYTTLPNVSEDVDLYAHWDPTEIDIKFRVNYPDEDNAPVLAVDRISMNYGDVIDFEIPADTEEYKFIGWNVKKDGTGDYYVNGDILERSLRLTLYAIWEKK